MGLARSLVHKPPRKATSRMTECMTRSERTFGYALGQDSQQVPRLTRSSLSSLFLFKPIQIRSLYYQNKGLLQVLGR